MIVNDYHKEIRQMSEALRDLGYTDATTARYQTFKSDAPAPCKC